MLGKNKARIVHIWLSRVFWSLFSYRLERALFLTLGGSYAVLRIFFTPIFNLIQAYSNIDIHYKAKIRGGLLVLHPSVGVVVSGMSVIGCNLTLTGGNIIGAKPGFKTGQIRLGDDCTLGANAVVLGPITLASGVRVGASACVIDDCLKDNSVLVGIPAKDIKKENMHVLGY